MKGLILATIYILFVTIRSQDPLTETAIWCTINVEEQAKCLALKAAIVARHEKSTTYPPLLKGYDQLPQLECIQANDPFACMEYLDQQIVDLVQLDAGMGYTGGEFFNLMPIMAEKYITTGDETEGISYKAVAVKRKGTDIDINKLAEAKACHTGVGRAAGWVHPISELIERDIMPISVCNVPVKSAADFFGKMCAPNALSRYYNPFGNNPVTVCENCKGTGQTFCTSNDPYAGYSGAFNCMASLSGDVAFIRDSTVMMEIIDTNYTMSDFELLCLDGTTAPVDQSENCHWGEVSSHIVMTSAMREEEKRENFKTLIKLMSYDFGENGEHNDIFRMFESASYGKKNLMFTDETMSLVDVMERDTYYSWAGEEYRKKLLTLNTCPLKQVRWCVISRHEMEKCENMIMAFAARNLKPNLNCILGKGVQECVAMINLGDADLITLDAADVYYAGKYHGLIPIAAEDYFGKENLNRTDDDWVSPKYYAIAVARRTDSYLTAFNMKGRRSCHSAVMTAAGWVIPISKLIETGQIHLDGNCNIYLYLGQYFSKSCAPGVLNTHYNPHNNNPINMCEACSSGGQDRCMRNSEEMYYGNSGAFRCLAEKGGDIAFVKHTTPRENTDGRNSAEWARNRRSDDYELLCNDGTRRDIDYWQHCNQGEVPANAIMTADFKTPYEREIIWTLINYGQQFFSADDNDDFPMFSSNLDQKDLMFQDSTVRLLWVPIKHQNYKNYLGPSFIRSMERMENMDCITDNSGSAVSWSMLTLLSVLLTTHVVNTQL